MPKGAEEAEAPTIPSRRQVVTHGMPETTTGARKRIGSKGGPGGG